MRDLLPIDQECAGIGIVDAKDELRQLRTPRSKQTGQAYDLADVEIQVEGLQCALPAQALCFDQALTLHRLLFARLRF